MRLQELEPEMEALLERLEPGWTALVRGATERQIAQIEEYAGQPLPRFYRWLLGRMGASMGPFIYDALNFSVDALLADHAREREKLGDQETEHPEILIIGLDSVEGGEFDLWYQLDRRVRDDAEVRMYTVAFETMREMFAWHMLLDCRMNQQPYFSRGIVETTRAGVLFHLGPLLESMGFAQSVPSGEYTGLYESREVCVITSASLNGTRGMHSFCISGTDSRSVRDVLGAIRSSDNLWLDVSDWFEQK